MIQGASNEAIAGMKRVERRREATFGNCFLALWLGIAIGSGVYLWNDSTTLQTVPSENALHHHHHHHWHAAQWRHNLLESVVFTSGDDAPLADALNAGVTTGQPVRVALVGRGRRAAYPRLLEDALAEHDGWHVRGRDRTLCDRANYPVGVASLRRRCLPARVPQLRVTDVGSGPLETGATPGTGGATPRFNASAWDALVVVIGADARADEAASRYAALEACVAKWGQAQQALEEGRG